VVLILDEIKKVHDDVLVELEGLVSKNTLSEDQFNSMVHKIKGGAQLLNARSFVEQCQNLERDGDLYQRIGLLTALLERENQVIKHYQDQYRR
jgi:two-component system sensor histidine kinase EvgS